MKSKIKKILREELLNEVGGQDIMDDFGSEVESLIDNILAHYEGRLSPTMVTGLLMNIVQKIGDKKGYTKDVMPDRYK